MRVIIALQPHGIQGTCNYIQLPRNTAISNLLPTGFIYVYCPLYTATTSTLNSKWQGASVRYTCDGEMAERDRERRREGLSAPSQEAWVWPLLERVCLGHLQIEKAAFDLDIFFPRAIWRESAKSGCLCLKLHIVALALIYHKHLHYECTNVLSWLALHVNSRLSEWQFETSSYLGTADFIGRRK